MQVIEHPDKKDWQTLLQRPYQDNTALRLSVQAIIKEVKNKGDAAVKAFTQQFEGIAVQELLVSEQEIINAESNVPQGLKNAVQQAAKNIEAFHKNGLSPTDAIETMPGITCWRKSVGIEKVGLYIPGGTAPLFSTVLMLGLPARLAGCKDIILCTPCGKGGEVNPAILYAAQVAGISKIYKAGGAQAIAAMAYGTETIPAVYKIFGPGNQYVTTAKQLVQLDGIAIDMPAGPSEVCIIADETANPAFVAADLLSQAEHGVDSQVLLVCTSAVVVGSCLDQIQKQLPHLPRKGIAQKALENSKAMVVRDMNEAVDLVNEYAAEHLIIICKGAEAIADKIINAGSVFIGHYSPESVGDYASGTNHTLPTNGFAKAYSGVSVDSFVKKITFQKLSAEGLHHIAETVITMAGAEGLEAHAAAVKVRLSELGSPLSPPVGGGSPPNPGGRVQVKHSF